MNQIDKLKKKTELGSNPRISINGVFNYNHYKNTIVKLQ